MSISFETMRVVCADEIMLGMVLRVSLGGFMSPNYSWGCMWYESKEMFEPCFQPPPTRIYHVRSSIVKICEGRMPEVNEAVIISSRVRHPW